MFRETVSVTTDGSGNAVAYTANVLRGKVHSIQYVPDGTNPYTNTVDFTITGDETGQNLWTESNIAAAKTVCPRQPTHDAIGAASLFAAAGEPVEDKIAIVDERVKISLAQGGAAKTGKFHICWEK